MKEIIIICFGILFFILVFYFFIIYPIRLKHRIISKAKDIQIINSNNYVFRHSVIGYIIVTLMGCFFLALFCTFSHFLYISDVQIGAFIFGVFILLLNFVLACFCFIKVFIMFPKAYISSREGVFKYYNGFRNKICLNFNDINQIPFEDYFRSLFFCLSIKTNDMKKVNSLNILLFENPSLIYAILYENKNTNYK